MYDLDNLDVLYVEDYLLVFNKFSSIISSLKDELSNYSIDDDIILNDLNYYINNLNSNNVFDLSNIDYLKSYINDVIYIIAKCRWFFDNDNSFNVFYNIGKFDIKLLLNIEQDSILDFVSECQSTINDCLKCIKYNNAIISVLTDFIVLLYKISNCVKDIDIDDKSNIILLYYKIVDSIIPLQNILSQCDGKYLDMMKRRNKLKQDFELYEERYKNGDVSIRDMLVHYSLWRSIIV